MKFSSPPTEVTEHKILTTKDLELRKTNLLTQRPERIMWNIKDEHPKTKILKDKIYRDIDPEDIISKDQDLKDIISKDKDLKDDPTVFLMGIVPAQSVTG